MDISKDEGFTLIELMLALAIVGIVVALSTGFIVDLFNIVQPSAQRMNTKQMAEIRLTEISKYARSASKITNNEIETFSGETVIYNNNNYEILINNNDGTLKKLFQT